MNKTKIEKLLLELGLSPATKGFKYIKDIILLLDIMPLKTAYREVSKQNNITTSELKSCIYSSFELIKNRNINPDFIKELLTDNPVESIYFKLKEGD